MIVGIIGLAIILLFFSVFFTNKQTQKLQKLAAVTNYSRSVNHTLGLSKANVTYTNNDIGEIRDLILDKTGLSRNRLWLL